MIYWNVFSTCFFQTLHSLRYNVGVHVFTLCLWLFLQNFSYGMLLWILLPIIMMYVTPFFFKLKRNCEFLDLIFIIGTGIPVHHLYSSLNIYVLFWHITFNNIVCPHRKTNLTILNSQSHGWEWLRKKLSRNLMLNSNAPLVSTLLSNRNSCLVFMCFASPRVWRN